MDRLKLSKSKYNYSLLKNSDEFLPMKNLQSNKYLTQSEASEWQQHTSTLIKNLNKPKVVTKVDNPFYGYQSDTKNDTLNKNKNNNTHKGKIPECSRSGRNSFLNILSRTIQSVINQNNPDHTKIESKTKTLRDANVAKRDFRIDDIRIDLDDNDDEHNVELKVRIPRNCLNNRDLAKLKGNSRIFFSFIGKITNLHISYSL